MSLNPQKMFNDKFGSTEQQNEQHFNQVFPKTNTNNFAQVTETISNNFDVSKFIFKADGDPTLSESVTYTISVPVNGNVENWTFNIQALSTIGTIEKQCKEIALALSKWGYAYTVYSQMLQAKEDDYEVWLKMLMNNTRASLLSMQSKSPTEKYIEELTIAQNYQEYVKKASQIATLKNTREMIRLAILEPLKEQGEQITNLIEVFKIMKGEK